MARKSGKIEAKETLLLVVEGQTEQIYFSQMRTSLRMSNISVEPKLSPKNDPLNIIETARKEQEKADYDHTWCIFDLDTLSSGTHQEAIKKAKKYDIKIADSLPCFEVWYLFHYAYSTKSYTKSDQVQEELCVYIKDYCKKQDWLRKKDLFSCLKDKLDNAIKNSKNLEKYNKENAVRDGTKCDIYKIFEKIEKINKGKPW